MGNTEKDARSCLEKFLSEINSTSATKQIFLGTASGWCTGFLTGKFGKVVAVAVGGGIVLLQIANHKGYIKINWDKVNTKLDKVSDKVEKSLTGQEPGWMDKAERYIDRKIDKASNVLDDSQRKTKRWYQSITGDSDFKLQEIHVFLVSFAAGVAIGIATS